jgi:hypothetical protein
MVARNRPFHPVLIGYDMMSSPVVTIPGVLMCTKSEVSQLTNHLAVDV